MYDACALFESELGLEPRTFFLEVEKNPKKIKSALKATGLCDQNMMLSEDLYQKGNPTPLLTKGTDLWNNIDSVIRRIAMDSESIERPKIAASDEVNIYLRGKIIEHVESTKYKILKAAKYKRIYDAEENKKDFKEIADALGEIIDKYLASPEVLFGIFSAIKNQEKSFMLDDCVNASFLSMFTLKNRKGFSEYSENSREQLIDIGSAALFRDISKITYAERYSPEDICEHPEKSAEIAEEIGLNPDVIFAIRNHHNISLDKTELNSPSENAQLYKDVIVVVDMFIDLTSEKKFNENEVIIGFNNLAKSGYLDELSVIALGNMYVGKDKNSLIANGLSLIRECKSINKKAYIWDPKAQIPYAIICANLKCKHKGPFYVETHRTIETDFDMGMVPPGKYSHCRKLTKKLIESGSNVLSDELISKLCEKLNIKSA
jgi:hypothetical protein